MSKDGESSGEKKWDRERGPKCFNCLKWGHIKARCPEAAETINYGGQDQENGDRTQLNLMHFLGMIFQTSQNF